MNLSDHYQVDSEVTFQKLEDATVLVHLTTGRIHHTNATGSRVWELLEAGRSVGEILETLQTEFEASGEQLQAEVGQFLEQLSTENMIHPAGAKLEG